MTPLGTQGSIISILVLTPIVCYGQNLPQLDIRETEKNLCSSPRDSGRSMQRSHIAAKAILDIERLSTQELIDLSLSDAASLSHIAAWERVKRADRARAKEMINWFIGYFEGKNGVSVPGFWRKDIRIRRGVDMGDPPESTTDYVACSAASTRNKSVRIQMADIAVNDWSFANFEVNSSLVRASEPKSL